MGKATRATSAAQHAQQLKRYGQIAQRAAVVSALARENTPEARAARRKMNDSVVGKATTVLGDYWRGSDGTGRVRVRGNCDAARVAKKLKLAGVERHAAT